MSVTSEIAAVAVEDAWGSLRAPVRRVTLPDTPVPFAPAVEQAVLPQAETIADAIRDLMAPVIRGMFAQERGSWEPDGTGAVGRR